MFFVYFRTYIGIADDVAQRLRDHNSGSVRSTKAFRPYRVLHTEVYTTKREVRQRELRLKNHSATQEELFRKLGLRK